MAHQLPAVEFFSTSILSNHAVRKRHERYTAVLNIRKIPYVYHDMASDEDAKKRWRIKARDPTIPGLLVHNEWRGTFAEFEEAVEYDELDLFLAIDHERLKREQELYAKDAAPAEPSAPESSSSSSSSSAAANGTANGTASQASTKYTGEPPPRFAPEGTGKRRSLTADDFLKALGIDESSVDVDDAELSELLSDSSLRVTTSPAQTEQPTSTGINGRLKTNAERGIGAVAAARNEQRKAQHAAPDEEKLKAQGLGPLALGAPVELFTTSMLANPAVREKHERYLEVLSSNQIHFRKYDLISEDDAKKRWRSKTRDPQLPGILVHGEWRGSFADFDAAAKNGPQALAEFLNIDDRLALASVNAARKNMTSGEPDEEGEFKLNPKRFTLGIDDFLSSLGVSDLKLDDLSIDDLLSDQHTSTTAKSSASVRAETAPENGVAGLRLKKGVQLPVIETASPEVVQASEEEPAITEEAAAAVDVPDTDLTRPPDATTAEDGQGSETAAELKDSPGVDVDTSATAEEEIVTVPIPTETEPVPEEQEAAAAAEDGSPADEKPDVESQVTTEDVPVSDGADFSSMSGNNAVDVRKVDAEATAPEQVIAPNDDGSPPEVESTSEPPADKDAEAEKPLPTPVAESNADAVVPVLEEGSDEPGRTSTAAEEDQSTRPSADEPSSSNHAAEGSGGEPSSSVNATSPSSTVRKPRRSKSRSAVASSSADHNDPVSPGRRALDYQRPTLTPSSSMPVSPSPLSPEGGVNSFATAIERSGSATSNLSIGGVSARNRSGSGSAKKGLGSRLSSMKFGKDKDKDRSSPSSIGLGSPGAVSEETDSPTRRRASGERGGGLFKSRSRSPGRHKSKDKDRGNAPPLPSLPRDRVSAAQRAERTLSQILRDADEAMRTADAQMLSSDEEGGEEDENGDIDEEDEGAAEDPFGADQVSVGVKKSSEGAAG